MAALFGVHVGNSSACLAISKDDGRVEVVANDAGDRITPTILQWTTSSCTVGKTAELELFRNTLNTIIRNKQLINSNIAEDELEHLRKKIPYKINKSDTEFKYELLYESKQWHVSPREIMGWIFKKLLNIAQSAVGGNKDIKVVITVPLYYTPKSIQLVKEVAKIAGFHILQVVDEASAGALGSGLKLDANEPPYYCIVYRVGGVSIDATILLVQDGMFSVVETVHKFHLGGALFTEKLCEYLINEFKRQYRSAEISERGKLKLMSAAENAKQVLSIQNLVQCSCESVGSGYDFSCSVSRARYENIIASLIPEIVAPITEVLNRAKVTPENIKKVITCGGTMKTPKLLETIKRLLPHSEVLNSSPDEVIALGAAKQAGYLTGHDRLPDALGIETPCLSTSLFIRVKKESGDDVVHRIPENSTVPLRKRFEHLADEESLVVCLENSDNKNLGSLFVSNIQPSCKAVITLDISKEGKIVVTLTNSVNKEKSHLKCDLSEITMT